MDHSSFTDLLSAAMSESGLIDLDTSDDQHVVDVASHCVANSQPVVGIATSQELISVTVPLPQVQTNSIIVRHPELQSRAGSFSHAAIQNSAGTQEGVHKIVIRPVPAGLQKSSIPSRQLQPVVLQPTVNRQTLVPTNVTAAGHASVLPLLQTRAPHVRSNPIIRPQIVPSVSAAGVPTGAVRPTLNAGTVRLTAVPRQLRLPTTSSNVRLQIRPRLPVSTVIPQPSVPAAGSLMQPARQTVSDRPALIPATVPSTVSRLVPLLHSSLSTTAGVSVSSMPGITVASSAQPAASLATVCVSSVASSVVSVSCVSSQTVITSMQSMTSCVSTGQSGLLSVTSTLADSASSLNSLTVRSQVDTHVDSSSVIMSSDLLSSADEVARSVSTVTVSASSVNRCSTDISTRSLDVPTSSDQPGDVSSAVNSSENLFVTAADSEAEQTAAKTKSEADDEQVR